VRAACAQVQPAPYQGTHVVGAAPTGADAAGLIDVPMYQLDALVRRAGSLQRTREGRTPVVTY